MAVAALIAVGSVKIPVADNVREVVLLLVSQMRQIQLAVIIAARENVLWVVRTYVCIQVNDN